MIAKLGEPFWKIITGNILLIICCGFYLAWWILAFRPTNPVRGVGKLLIPAVIAGLICVVLLVNAIMKAPKESLLLSNYWFIIGGIAAYIALWLVTTRVFRRPVTTELFLIVGWCILALSVVNSLLGYGLFSSNMAYAFMVIIVAAVVVSLVCYVWYYRLDASKSYYYGMVPLLLIALVQLAISICMAVTRKG